MKIIFFSFSCFFKYIYSQIVEKKQVSQGLQNFKLNTNEH